MAIDEELTELVRAALADAPAASEVSEMKMFGGVCFMMRGNMLAGASDRGLLVRVGEPGARAALARGGASPMIMRGRAMPGYVRVAPDGLDAPAVRWWVQLARAFVETLPAKAPRRPPSRGSAKTAAPPAVARRSSSAPAPRPPSPPPARRRKARAASKSTTSSRRSR